MLKSSKKVNSKGSIISKDVKKKLTAVPVRKRKTTKVSNLKTTSIKPHLNTAPIRNNLVVFRINQTDVRISDAKNVYVGQGMIEVKY